VGGLEFVALSFLLTMEPGEKERNKYFRRFYE